MSPPPPNGPEPTTDRDLDPDERALHAVLDDEATATQRALVADRPDLSDRLEELRAIRTRLADTAATDPAVARTMVARALDAAEAGRADPVRSLPSRSSTRRPAASWLVAAAVVIVLALGALSVPRLMDSGSETDTAAGPAAESSADGSADLQAEGDASSAPTTTAPSPSSESFAAADNLTPRDLGPRDSLDDLVAAAREALDESDQARTSGPPGTDPQASASVACTVDVLPPTGDVLLLATSALAGRPVVLAVVASESGGPEIVRVVTSDDCSLVFVGPL